MLTTLLFNIFNTIFEISGYYYFFVPWIIGTLFLLFAIISNLFNFIFFDLIDNPILFMDNYFDYYKVILVYFNGLFITLSLPLLLINSFIIYIVVFFINYDIMYVLLENLYNFFYYNFTVLMHYVFMFIKTLLSDISFILYLSVLLFFELLFSVLDIFYNICLHFYCNCVLIFNIITTFLIKVLSEILSYGLAAYNSLYNYFINLNLISFSERNLQNISVFLQPEDTNKGLSFTYPRYIDYISFSDNILPLFLLLFYLFPLALYTFFSTYLPIILYNTSITLFYSFLIYPVVIYFSLYFYTFWIKLFLIALFIFLYYSLKLLELSFYLFMLKLITTLLIPFILFLYKIFKVVIALTFSYKTYKLAAIISMIDPSLFLFKIAYLIKTSVYFILFYLHLMYFGYYESISNLHFVFGTFDFTIPNDFFIINYKALNIFFSFDFSTYSHILFEEGDALSLYPIYINPKYLNSCILDNLTFSSFYPFIMYPFRLFHVIIMIPITMLLLVLRVLLLDGPYFYFGIYFEERLEIVLVPGYDGIYPRFIKALRPDETEDWPFSFLQVQSRLAYIFEEYYPKCMFTYIYNWGNGNGNLASNLYFKNYFYHKFPIQMDLENFQKYNTFKEAPSSNLTIPSSNILADIEKASILDLLHINKEVAIVYDFIYNNSTLLYFYNLLDHYIFLSLFYIDTEGFFCFLKFLFDMCLSYVKSYVNVWLPNYVYVIPFILKYSIFFIEYVVWALEQAYIYLVGSLTVVSIFLYLHIKHALYLVSTILINTSLTAFYAIENYSYSSFTESICFLGDKLKVILSSLYRLLLLYFVEFLIVIDKVLLFVLFLFLIFFCIFAYFFYNICIILIKIFLCFIFINILYIVLSYKK